MALPARAERADREKPMHLEADKVNIDDARQTSTFEGHVVLTQGTMTIRGDKIIVVQGKESYAHGTALGAPASFRQKREGAEEYIEGYGERIEYDTQNETVDLYGHARMKQKQDEVTGDHISYSAKTEIFHVDGAPVQHGNAGAANAAGRTRVRVILQPKGAGMAPEASPPGIQPADALHPPKND